MKKTMSSEEARLIGSYCPICRSTGSSNFTMHQEANYGSDIHHFKKCKCGYIYDPLAKANDIYLVIEACNANYDGIQKAFEGGEALVLFTDNVTHSQCSVEISKCRAAAINTAVWKKRWEFGDKKCVACGVRLEYLPNEGNHLIERVYACVSCGKTRVFKKEVI